MTTIGGKAAFVTGGGSGIGRSLALALAAAGAGVAVADIRSDDAHRVADEVTAAGGTALAVTCDVSDRGSVLRAKAEANDVLGPVGLLFANAGVTSWQRLTDMSDEDVDWVYGVNLMGAVHCLRAFLPDMAAAGDGHVCATSSVAGLCPGWLPQHSAYAATKLGLIGLMLNLRHELAEVGVGATVLIPGPVPTGLGANTSRARPSRFGGPLDRKVELPRAASDLVAGNSTWREPEGVAAMALAAVRDDEPIVVTDPETGPFFQTYVDPMVAAMGRAADS